MEVRTVLWTAEAAVCESILRVEAACGVTWTLLKGGKGPFLGSNSKSNDRFNGRNGQHSGK